MERINFDKNVIKSLDSLCDLITLEPAVALYFSSPNCGVCEVLKPKIQQLIETQFPKIKFIEISSYQSPDISAHFGVFSAPTLLIFFEGKEFYRYVRNLSISELEERLRRPYEILVKS